MPKRNGSGAWTCAAEASGGGGTVTSVTAARDSPAGIITGAGTVAADTTYLQRCVNGVCAAGSSIRSINVDGTVVFEAHDARAGGAASRLAGNAGTSPATQFVGTTDNVALVIRVDNARALRIEANAISPPI